MSMVTLFLAAATCLSPVLGMTNVIYTTRDDGGVCVPCETNNQNTYSTNGGITTYTTTQQRVISPPSITVNPPLESRVVNVAPDTIYNLYTPTVQQALSLQSGVSGTYYTQQDSVNTVDSI